MDESSPLTYICIGSSFLFSRLFYNLYQEKKREIQQIKEIPKFLPNKDLLRAVNQSPQKRLLYAAVEGVVQPDGDPLESKYIPRCFAVIQKVQVEETWETWNSTSNTWFRRKMKSDHSNNMVPFHLVSPGAFVSNVVVKVQSPLESVEPYLEQVYHKVKYAKEGLLNLVMGDLAGERPFCLEESERILRVGTPLTGFGEVVLGHGRQLVLQPPTNGLPYVLFTTNYRTYLETHESTATTWKVLMAIFGFAGASLLAWTIYRAYQKYERKRGRS